MRIEGGSSERDPDSVLQISRLLYGSPAGTKWAGAEIKKWYGYQKKWYVIPLSEISQTCQITSEIVHNSLFRAARERVRCTRLPWSSVVGTFEISLHSLATASNSYQ